MSVFIRLSILLILCGSVSIVHAQVFEGDFVVQNQAQLDSFSYEEITGSFILEDRDAQYASDLTPLISLKKIGGDLFLENYAINTLNGLDSLREIGGTLKIIDAEIRDLAPLAQLAGIGGLHLEHLLFLKDLNGLSQIPDTLSTLSLTLMPKLESISPLSPLTYLQGELRIEGLNKLTSWQGLENLSSCEAVSITLNGEVDALDNFQALAVCKVRSSLQMGGTGIKHLDGFLLTDSLQHLDLGGLDNLETWPMFDNIVWANNISLFRINRPNLAFLQALGGPIASLTIKQINTTSLEGLEGITSIGTLDIFQCSILETLKGLEGVTEAEYVRINYSNDLVSLEGLDNLRKVGTLLIESLENVQTLQHLNSVERIEERLVITWLQSLEELDGFMNLTECTQPRQDKYYVGLKVEANPQLRHLNGFASLTGHFPTGIRIRNNDLLVDVDGLGNIESVGGFTQIENNPQLNDCCVLRKWVPTEEGIPIAIGNNATYCSGEHLVDPVGVCVNGIPSDSTNNPDPDPDPLTYAPDHPNPTTGPFTISYFSEGAAMFEVQFYDRLGRAVPIRVQMPAIAGWNRFTTDVSSLSPGLYFYRVEQPFFGELKKVVIGMGP